MGVLQFPRLKQGLGQNPEASVHANLNMVQVMEGLDATVRLHHFAVVKHTVCCATWLQTPGLEQQTWLQLASTQLNLRCVGA